MQGTRTIDYEPGLDGLRAVSVIAVLLFHACATSSLAGWVRGGNLGVSVFFTLSGFLITSILVAEHQRAGRIDLGRFWTRRIRRLVPASFAVIVAVIALSNTSLLAARSTDAIAATWSVTNWHVIAGGDDRLLQTIVGPLGPTWSLAVEEQLYVLLVIAVVAIGRSNAPRRNLAVVFSIVAATSVVLANTVSSWSPRLEFGTDVRAAEVAIGGLLALGVARWRAQLHARASLVDLSGAAALAILLGLFLAADYSPPWLLHGGFSVVALVSGTAIAGVLAHGHCHRLLAARPMVAVGRWSYAIYLVHWPLFLVLTPERTGLDGVALVVGKCTLALVVAVVLHLGVERPARRLDVPARTAIIAWLGAAVAITVVAATTLA